MDKETPDRLDLKAELEAVARQVHKAAQARQALKETQELPVRPATTEPPEILEELARRVHEVTLGRLVRQALAAIRDRREPTERLATLVRQVTEELPEPQGGLAQQALAGSLAELGRQEQLGRQALLELLEQLGRRVTQVRPASLAIRVLAEAQVQLDLADSRDELETQDRQEIAAILGRLVRLEFEEPPARPD